MKSRSAVSIFFALLGGAAVAVAGCSAGGGVVDDDDGAGGSGPSGPGAGNTTGTGFTGSGGSTTGSGSGCTDPSCIGGNPQGNCDTGLAIDSADAMDGAKAIGICQAATANSWGVLSAEWVRSDGQPLSGALTRGKGILSHFGNVINPREGASLLAISSGSARNPGDPEFNDPAGDQKDSSNSHGTPPGYPKPSPSCGVQAGPAYDSAGLRLVIKAPSDAKSFSFNLNFYTYEFPNYICDIYNDFFVAMMSPPDPSLPDGNISFDSQGNTISVNAGFLQACEAQTASNGAFFPCALGYGDIVGTGFDSQAGLPEFGIPAGSAATGWLETKAPITPGSEVTLHFAIWDSGDAVLDSTTLIDNFKFDVDETSTGTTPVPQ